MIFKHVFKKITIVCFASFPMTLPADMLALFNLHTKYFKVRSISMIDKIK